MEHADTALPPTHVIDAALRKTTERIALEVARPDPEMPTWSEFEWRIAMAASVMHGVSAVLAKRSRWQGPALWQDFLAEQARQGLLRQQRVVDLLARIDAAAQAAGIPLVAMKGSALLQLDLHGPGERPQSDIDLLAREQDFEATGRMLETLDFSAGVQVWRHQTFEPRLKPAHVAFGEHADNPIKVELHTRVMERLGARPTDLTEITPLVFPRNAHPGLNPYASTTALMLHLLLHTSGNLRMQGARMMQLLDIARLAARFAPADWEALLSDGGGPAGMWWALPVLNLVERYFPGTVPASLITQLAPACPRWLRAASRRQPLSELSLSRIRFVPFPGLLWTRSPAQTLLLIARRFFADREARTLTRMSHIAELSREESRWSQSSYYGKALRFLVSSPPRMATIYTVRRALDYRPHIATPGTAVISAYSRSNKAAV